MCGMSKKPSTSMYLSDEAKRLLALLAERFGVSKSAMLEFIIREKAKREKLK